jgi:hypothetical protein
METTGMVEVQTVHAINAVAEVGMITVHGKVVSRTRTQAASPTRRA